MEDLAIIQLYHDRNETAILETNRKYGAYCFAIAHNILANHQDSEECVNDTWLRAWNSMPPQRPNLLQQFLGKITRNLSFDRYRKSRSEKRGSGEMELALEELGQCISGGHDPASAAELRALQESIQGFLEDLPQRDRGIFLRRFSMWRIFRPLRRGTA